MNGISFYCKKKMKLKDRSIFKIQCHKGSSHIIIPLYSFSVTAYKCMCVLRDVGAILGQGSERISSAQLLSGQLSIRGLRRAAKRTAQGPPPPPLSLGVKSISAAATSAIQYIYRERERNLIFMGRIYTMLKFEKYTCNC